jgi:hypothetical protein
VRRFSTVIGAFFIELTRLSQSDTRAYLQERATQAGFTDLFTPAALDLIVDASRGLPRSLWSIAGLAYFYAASAGASQISRQHVADALASQIPSGARVDNAAAPSPRSEIPVAPRGAGIQTIDGFMERTPFESQVDLEAAWALKFSGNRRITFMADVFNLFNQKRILNYDQDTQLNAGTANLDFGKPVNSLLSGTPAQYQVPITLRVGARFQF